MTQECACKRERKEIKVNNNNTKRFPGNQSKKISKNGITKIIVTESDFPKEEGSRRGKKGARDKTKRATKEVKERKRERKRERMRTSTTTVDWMDCIVLRERD